MQCRAGDTDLRLPGVGKSFPEVRRECVPSFALMRNDSNLHSTTLQNLEMLARLSLSKHTKHKHSLEMAINTSKHKHTNTV